MDLYYFNIAPLRNRIVFSKEYVEMEESRKDKIDKFKRPDDKLRSLGAGMLIKYIREKYDIEDEIVVDKYGKPYFENADLYFNVSHSGSYVIAAVSKHMVGADIQRIEQDTVRIAERNFADSECDYINDAGSEEEINQRFCEVWTSKEAYLKYTGIGLRKPLNSFEIKGLGEEEPCIDDRDDIKLIQMKLDDRYIVSVCVNSDDTKLNMQEVSIAV